MSRGIAMHAKNTSTNGIQQVTYMQNMAWYYPYNYIGMLKF